MDDKMPKEILIRKADTVTSRITIPRRIIKRFGWLFSMEVYEDKIVLKPTKEE